MDIGLRSGSTPEIRAPLRATLLADQGPTKGRIIAMDEHRLQMLSSKKLVPGAVYRGRIDLDRSPHQLDVKRRVERVQNGQDTDEPHGPPERPGPGRARHGPQHPQAR